MSKIKHIVIHCSATRENADYSFEQLEAGHLARGFRSCGYNLYVRKNGEVNQGRPFGSVLAHAIGYNFDSIAVCYEGGLDVKGKAKDTRTPQQRQALLTIVLYCKLLYPGAKVVGHRDLSPDLNNDGKITPNEWVKQCPCYDVMQEYKLA